MLRYFQESKRRLVKTQRSNIATNLIDNVGHNNLRLPQANNVNTVVFCNGSETRIHVRHNYTSS